MYKTKEITGSFSTKLGDNDGNLRVSHDLGECRLKKGGVIHLRLKCFD